MTPSSYTVYLHVLRTWLWRYNSKETNSNIILRLRKVETLKQLAYTYVKCWRGWFFFFKAMSPIWHTVPLAKPRARWVLAIHSHFTCLLIVSNFFSTLIVNCASIGVALEGLGFMFLIHFEKENQTLLNKVKGTQHKWLPWTNRAQCQREL